MCGREAAGRSFAAIRFDFCRRRQDNHPTDVKSETHNQIQRAAAELRVAGAREIYVFGSAAKGTAGDVSDLDLAVSGLPPSVFYRMGARVSDLLGCPVDLVTEKALRPELRSYIEREAVHV